VQTRSRVKIGDLCRNNRKAKYLSDGGLFPFVRLTEASGAAYAEGERFIAAVSDRHELDLRAREHRRCAGTEFRSSSKGIEDFRANPRYGGDATRVDLAFAIYALSHGADAEQVAAALRSRDLSHKGDEKRQMQYVDRTVGKALKATESRCR